MSQRTRINDKQLTATEQKPVMKEEVITPTQIKQVNACCLSEVKLAYKTSGDNETEPDTTGDSVVDRALNTEVLVDSLIKQQLNSNLTSDPAQDSSGLKSKHEGCEQVREVETKVVESVTVNTELQLEKRKFSDLESGNLSPEKRQAVDHSMELQGGTDGGAVGSKSPTTTDEVDSKKRAGADSVRIKDEVQLKSAQVQEKIDLTTIDGYKEMPFLSDPATIEFIQNSHTMFLMRGLPGSGKSTIARGLCQLYRGSVVCSADDFFMDEQGNYNYARSKINDAHKYCQEKASTSCENGAPVVIIDNTNIQAWTMAFYMRQANTISYYHAIIVEPQTPWRYDVAELARRNKHHVEEEFIAQKLRSLKDNKYMPMYYGWFLNHTGSALLADKARTVLQTFVADLQQGGQSSNDIAGLKDMLENFSELYTDPRPMLHCTANYLSGKKKDPYHTCAAVKHAMGRHFRIAVSGFVYSKRAICARVDLYAETTQQDEDNRKNGNNDVTYANDILENSNSDVEDYYVNDSPYGNDDDSSSESADENQACSSFANDNEEMGNVGSEAMLNLFVKEEEDSIRYKYEGMDSSVPGIDADELFRHGCSAHVTISYAKGGQAKYSGEDVLNLLELEFYGKAKMVDTSVGTGVLYADNKCRVTLKEPLVLDCLFHGYYSVKSK